MLGLESSRCFSFGGSLDPFFGVKLASSDSQLIAFFFFCVPC